MTQNLVLAVHTYPGANSALERHWPYILRSGASKYVVVTTDGGGCWAPEEVDSVAIGKDSYISGLHLPIRWLRTLEYLISLEIPWIGIVEYDHVPIRSFLPLEMGFTAHLTGGKPLGANCNQFHHMPHLMDRTTAIHLWTKGWELIRSGKPVDASPDLFVGQIVEGEPRNDFDLFTRNTISSEEDIAMAREAVKRGVNALHGIKTKEVLDAILAP